MAKVKVIVAVFASKRIRNTKKLSLSIRRKEVWNLNQFRKAIKDLPDGDVKWFWYFKPGGKPFGTQQKAINRLSSPLSKGEMLGIIDPSPRMAHRRRL